MTSSLSPTPSSDVSPAGSSAASAPSSAAPSSAVFACPVCRATLAPADAGPTRCPNCRWKGEAYGFSPKALTAERAEAALPEDAVCLHHPSKRATAVCVGTGDYICSLCSVEIDGQTYSAEYLNAGGNQTAKKAFDRKLPRPDSYIYLYLLLLFVPYVNVLMIPFAFVWIPHAVVLYVRALRLRKENPLFARVMGRGRVVTLPILLGLVSVGWVVGVVALTLALVGRHH